jgi:hypothetical protein
MEKYRPARLAATFLLAGLAGCGVGVSQVEPNSGQSSLAKTPVERAAMEIAGARELESQRKPREALEAYQRIVKDFPDSPQAKMAVERIKALGGQ